jgi:hypothetical protein
VVLIRPGAVAGYAERSLESRDQKSAVYYDRLPSEVIACWRRKKNSSADQVRGLTAPAHRHAVLERGGEGRIIEQRLS